MDKLLTFREHCRDHGTHCAYFAAYLGDEGLGKHPVRCQELNKYQALGTLFHCEAIVVPRVTWSRSPTLLIRGVGTSLQALLEELVRWVPPTAVD